MTTDSRRYHRVRRPPVVRRYGALQYLGLVGGDTAGTAAAGSAATGAAEAASTAAESAAPAAATTAAGATPTLAGVGNFLLNRATGGLVKGAESAFSDIGHGIQSLFGTGTAENTAGLVGPPAPTGPGFVGGFWQGFTHDAPSLVHPSAGTSLGRGLGDVANMLDQLNAQSGTPPPLPQTPIIRIGQPITPIRQVVPAAPAQPATGPIMSLLKPIGSL